MKKLVIIFIFALSVAQEATHVVKPGDTLWDIAGFYYQNAFLWPYIWRANLTKINDPHWIYPDQSFVIPPSPEGIPVQPGYVPEYPTVPAAKPPAAEVVSVVKAEERVFTEEMIHRAGFILTEELPYWGRILDTEPKELENLTTFERVYIDRADVQVGDILTVYRNGKEITHPTTGARLGQEVTVLGKAEVTVIGEEGARCKLVASYDIIRKGDLLTPYEPIIAPAGVSFVETNRDLTGFVVEVKSRDVLTQPHVFVYIDHGEESDIAVGDLFTIYQEREIDGKKMPDFEIGKVQVVSVFQNASIALLLWERETNAIKRGEKIRLAMESR